jgi:ubiquinol-cytochrome c reductase cytochrome c subunit
MWFHKGAEGRAMRMRRWTFAIAVLWGALCLDVVEVRAEPARAPAVTVERGRQLFLADGCYQCHGTRGQGGGAAGPRLAPSPIPFPAFALQVRNPRDKMPVYTAAVLSENDLAALFAYLQSIPQAKSVAEIPLLKGVSPQSAAH